MTTHVQPPFTPAQLIDAGRRAEAEGRFDLAVQFYRHLTDNFAGAAETLEAHGALGRIGVRQPQEDGGTRPVARRALRRRLPSGRDRYAVGRTVTRFFGLLGWLVALAVPAAVPACLVLPLAGDACPARPEALPVLAGGVAGSLILGFGIVLTAHVARARFDEANAVRDLLALERARLGLD